MPKETEEAAMVDGAGNLRVFRSVMLPGAVTILITVALFSFVWQWNDVFFSNLYNKSFESLSNTFLRADTGSFTRLFSEYDGFQLNDPIIVKNFTATCALMVVFPLIVLFLFLQKYFVESVERSGLVG